jgi:hypothetical protein
LKIIWSEAEMAKRRLSDDLAPPVNDEGYSRLLALARGGEDLSAFAIQVLRDLIENFPRWKKAFTKAKAEVAREKRRRA